MEQVGPIIPDMLVFCHNFLVLLENKYSINPVIIVCNVQVLIGLNEIVKLQVFDQVASVFKRY